jgi:hypothetical protein
MLWLNNVFGLLAMHVKSISTTVQWLTCGMPEFKESKAEAVLVSFECLD